MTKQLTRQEVESVVEVLQNPNPRLYCPNCHNDTIKCTDCDYTLWKNDHTYIGTVLEKIQNNEYFCTMECEMGEAEELIMLWQPLGLSRSLQEIIEESGYTKLHKTCTLLKSPEANALFSFLQEIL